MNTNHVAAILVGFGSLAGAAAHAATATGNMAVTATVNRTCTATVGPLAFGPLSSTGVNNAQATVSISCTAVATDAPTMTFGPGANLNQDGVRGMSGGDTLPATIIPYNLLTDSGESVDAAPVPLITSNGGSTYAATIRGTVAGSPTYQLGTYSDTVLVTITYDGAAGGGA